MKHRRILPLALAASLAGCSAGPLDYHSQAEIPSGPGLLSGKEGAFVYRAEEPAAKDSAEYREFQEWREWREWKRNQNR